MIPVIIPFFKDKEKLEKCEDHLFEQTHPIEVFIRDNSDDNILYTKAINEGLRKFAYRDDIKYCLVLTQDAYLDPHCIQRLSEHLDENPRVGIACPIQVVDGRVTWGGSLQAFPSGVHFCPPLHALKQPFNTFWANGACMLLRNQMIKEIGLMDENMRFICSDSDYSFTAKSRGWEIAVVPSAVATHELDGSARSMNPWLDKIKVEDSLYFTQKWLTGDLYRSISYEGKDLSNSRIKNELYRMVNWHKKISEVLLRVPVSEPLPVLTPSETLLEKV